MLRVVPVFFLSFVVSAFAQNTSAVTITSIADPSVGLAPESFAMATGTNLALQTVKARSVPWPTTLGDVDIQITDSAGIARMAGLIYVSSHTDQFSSAAGNRFRSSNSADRQQRRASDFAFRTSDFGFRTDSARRGWIAKG